MVIRYICFMSELTREYLRVREWESEGGGSEGRGVRSERMKREG